MNVEKRLDQIVELLAVLVGRQTERDWYTTAQFARLIGRAEFSVREMCRLGRIRAEKKLSGRGSSLQWVISHKEMQRFQREGLLPKK